MAKIATIKIKSESPITFARYYLPDVPKLDKESSADYEERTWRERAHYDPKTQEVWIPPLALKNCLGDAAKFLSIQIPGKGKSTYTKHFDAGILVTDPLMLGVKKDALERLTIHAPADGRPGGSKRVIKHFPMIREWKAEAKIIILDDTITKDVLVKHIEEAGKFIGMGSLRVRNRGINGRFSLVSISMG